MRGFAEAVFAPDFAEARFDGDLAAAFFFAVVGSGGVAFAVSCEDCVWRDSEEVGRSDGDAAGDDEVDVGVAPHLPKNHPPELLPVAGPSFLRGPRF